MTLPVFTAAVLGLAVLIGGAGPAAAAGSALSNEPIPMIDPEQLPERTPPIEIGPDFLGAGNIPRGIKLPTGAVWTPALWVFGDLRTSFNYVDNDEAPEIAESAVRLDIFANLQLSGTERVLLGMSPLRSDGDFTSYVFEPDADEGFKNEFNADITTLFFEGEFGEIFPNLDIEDSKSLDIGFAVGRQPIFFQEGMMFNDTIDSIALTRDTVSVRNFSPDTRVTALFGWNDIDRDDNREDHKAMVFGVFTETDFRKTTTNFDVALVTSNERNGGDGLFAGASAVQRLGLWNTAFRVNTSIALETEAASVSDGTLLFGEISRTLSRSEDIVYGNFFWAINDYSSAARDATTGGPLARTGLLFESVGLGQYSSALSNRADNVVGGALGHQIFFNNNRTQLVLELGGRKGTKKSTVDAGAAGFRFQQAVGSRFVVRLDGYGAIQEHRDGSIGVRTEFMIRI